MLRYAVKKLLSLVSLGVASAVIFLALEVVPGDPAAYMLGINAQEDTLAALREELGLDRGPLASGISLGSAACWGRFRHLLHLPHAGGGDDRRPAAGEPAAGALRAGAEHADCLPGGHLGGIAARLGVDMASWG